MKIKPEILSRAGEKGADSASKALTMLLNKEVMVEASKVKALLLGKFEGLIGMPEHHQVVAFAQVLTGAPGVVLMVLSRSDALNLVDILLGKKVGETKVLQEMDRSAVKETLNILSNSHITALAESLGITIEVSVPQLISPQRISQVIEYLAEKVGEEQEVVVFETRLMVKEIQNKVNLFIIFGSGLAKSVGKEV